MTAVRIPTALRGALGFLSRLPVTRREGDFEAFRRTPAAFPLAGYVVGAAAAVPFLVALPAPAAAAAYLALVYLVSGVNHADGLADLGDAAAVHGDADRRRAAMKDATTGAGATLAVAVGVAALALGALGVAGLPALPAAGLVVAAEVGAKLAMAVVACVGEASHEGFGSGFTAHADPSMLGGVTLAALPAALLTGGSLAAAVALVAAGLVAVLLVRWAERRLGGVGGDTFGAANELARVAALHAGALAWHAL